MMKHMVELPLEDEDDDEDDDEVERLLGSCFKCRRCQTQVGAEFT